MIEKFILEYLPQVDSGQDIRDVFREYWDEEKQAELEALCASEGMDQQAIIKIIEEYHFTGKEPLRETIFEAMEDKPKLLERKKIFERVVRKLLELINKFDDDMGDI